MRYVEGLYVDGYFGGKQQNLNFQIFEVRSGFHIQNPDSLNLMHSVQVCRNFQFNFHHI